MFCEFIDYIDNEFGTYYKYCTVKNKLIDPNDCNSTCEDRKRALKEGDFLND